MNLPVLDVIEIIKMSGIAVESNTSQNDNGETYDMFDLMESGELAEEKVIQEENIYVILEKIEMVFNGLQERQKKIVSDVITAKICDTIEDINIAVEHFDFINVEIFEKYKKTRRVPTQRDIAVKHKRDEASISISAGRSLHPDAQHRTANRRTPGTAKQRYRLKEQNNDNRRRCRNRNEGTPCIQTHLRHQANQRNKVC